MADQDRCPECRGKAWNGWCPCQQTSDEGAGDREARVPDSETREPVCLSPQPSVPPAGNATPDRQSGEGSADGPSPDLPDEVLDRAVKKGLDRSSELDGWWRLGDEMRQVVEAVAPVLIEHGRQQERGRAMKAVLAVMYREEAECGNPAQTGDPPYTAHDESILGAVGDWHTWPLEPFAAAEARGAAAEKGSAPYWTRTTKEVDDEKA